MDVDTVFILNGNISLSLSTAWEYWLANKEDIDQFSFREWIEYDFGFTFKGYDLPITIVDQSKFEWFLLRF
jgi:hypothetical protein